MTIGVDDPVDHVMRLMVDQRLWLLPVLDGPRLVEVIRYATATGPANTSSGPSGRMTPCPALAQVGNWSDHHFCDPGDRLRLE